MEEHERSELSEIVESLDKLEINLLDYEKTLSESKEDSSYIHHIFRHAHNLKSILMMAKKEYSSHLVHAIETNFDQIRKGSAKSSIKLIQDCLLSIDIIKDNLFEEEENIFDIKAQIEVLESISESVSEEVVALPVIDLKLTNNQKMVYEKAKFEGLDFYLIEKMITSNLSKEDFKNLFIYEDIKNLGVHIVTYPEYEGISKVEDQAMINIVFVTKMPSEELSYQIFDSFKQVQIGNVENLDKKLAQETFVKEDLFRKDFRILIVEDDFISRTILQGFLNEYGICEIAVNGFEAIKAFEMRINENIFYDVICLDIMMPEMDGHEVLKKIRDIEQEKGIFGLEKVKVIMTTALDDIENVMLSFREQGDAYIVKPITPQKIYDQLRKLDLVHSKKK